MEIEQLKEEALKSVDKMVTTKAKAQAIAFLRDTLLPAVKQFADGLAQALKNSATSKTGWCYFRDAYLFPGIIHITCWGFGKLLDSVGTATEKEAAAEAGAAQTPEQEGSDAPAAQPGQA